MKRIRVNTNNQYDIVITEGFQGLSEEVSKVLRAKKILIVTDKNVAPLYLEVVKEELAKNYSVETLVIMAGEKIKTVQTYMQIINALGNAKLTRNDAVLALGGGVVGDITGFAAATYLRGIDLIQTPTTLLADIDSSVGGKTGVNLDSGKNLLGAFYQPKLVYINTLALSTMKIDDWKNGIGEGIKYAVLRGGEVLEILEKGQIKQNPAKFIELCVNIKKEIVEEDTFESGVRRQLNLGHTFGHAIEKLSSYTIPHGVAVVKGLIIAMEYSKRIGLDNKDIARVEQICKQYDIDSSCSFDKKSMAEVIFSDKKIESSGIVNFVVVKAIGDCITAKVKVEELV
ncbi:3-dehydroquinate synthase [bacterium]|nr:3-dehydroquinate synthase [bacterium]